MKNSIIFSREIIKDFTKMQLSISMIKFNEEMLVIYFYAGIIDNLCVSFCCGLAKEKDIGASTKIVVDIIPFNRQLYI